MKKLTNWKLHNDFGEMTLPEGWSVDSCKKERIVDILRNLANVIESGYFIDGEISLEFSRGVRETSVTGPSEYKRLEPDKEWDVSLNLLVTYIMREDEETDT
jgi:hypothetical protein